MTTLKEWMDEQWRKPGVIDGACGVIFEGTDYKSLRMRSGPERKIALDKETKRRQAGLAMYNKRLAPVILAEATKSDASYMVMGDNKLPGPIYRWERVQSPAEPAQSPVEIVPRRRVSHKKVAQAAAILERVPADELTAFLARFGLSLSLAASIASLDNVEQIARQFLRATL